MEERDLNELFDDIVLAEESLSKKGYDEGYIAGQEQGNSEGYQLGYAQGLQLGQELGQMYGLVVAEQTQQHTNKTKNVLQQLREAIEAFPRENDAEKDIIGAVQQLRSQYKRVRAMLGHKTMNKEGEDHAEELRADYSF